MSQEYILAPQEYIIAGHFGIMVVWFSHYSKVISASFWCHSGIILESFRHHSGVISESFQGYSGINPALWEAVKRGLGFFPQAMLGGFSFRAGEHTTSAVREIARPNQN